MHKLKNVLAVAAFMVVAVPALADGPNWVSNSNFANNANGSGGWTTGYKFLKYPATDKGPGYLQIGSDPNKATPAGSTVQWTTAGAPAGSGSPNFLMADGATTANTNVWSETFATKVIAGQKYDLGAMSMALDNDKGNYADLAFTINGSALVPGTLQLNSGDIGSWANMNTTWTATSTEFVTFGIDDKNTQQSGNDFGLDELSFRAVPEASTVVSFAILCLGGLFILRKRSQLNAMS
jgi:hypothetical protein